MREDQPTVLLATADNEPTCSYMHINSVFSIFVTESEREREREREIPSTFILKFFALTSVVNMLLVLGDQRAGVT